MSERYDCPTRVETNYYDDWERCSNDSFRVDCPQCGCRFEGMVEASREYANYPRYDFRYYTYCPECGEEIRVSHGYDLVIPVKDGESRGTEFIHHKKGGER